MNIKGLLTVLVAAALVLSIGVTSTSLDAIETDPSDQIDTSWIPTQDNKPQQNSGGGSSGGGGGSSSSSTTTSSESSSENSADLDRGSGLDAKLDQIQGSAEDKIDLSSANTESQTNSGGAEKALTLWQRLLNLIREYMWHILGGLAGIAALVVGYIVYRRWFAGSAAGKPEIVYDVDTSNDVYKSWWEMVEMLDADEPSTKTPQEFAEMAIEEGLDQEEVTELTRLFEEALYGGKEVTREQEKRAREAVERLKAKGREAV